MTRDRNTIAKRQREIKKKQKAEEKRALRRKRKEPATAGALPEHNTLGRDSVSGDRCT